MPASLFFQQPHQLGDFHEFLAALARRRGLLCAGFSLFFLPLNIPQAVNDTAPLRHWQIA
jgi:hypothetical protein